MQPADTNDTGVHMTGYAYSRRLAAAILCALSCAATMVPAAVHAETPPGLKPYVAVEAPSLVLQHVRIIDGTGAEALEDQRIDIAAGKIVRVASAKSRLAVPAGAKVLDLTG